MPEEDGYALLQQLRRIDEEQGLPRILAIAVTAFARGEDRDRALAAGFDEHLPKPVDADRLIRVIAQRLRGAQRKD
jgi:CheY-like chemotaxis protein